MSEIREILETGPSFRLDTPPEVRQEELDELRQIFGADLPAPYLEFIERGGLGELNFDQEILPPCDILRDIDYVPAGLLPIASNGCGDVFCVKAGDGPEYPVFFFDHEEGSLSQYESSLVACLRRWRRS
jgi:hypothetical protein